MTLREAGRCTYCGMFLWRSSDTGKLIAISAGRQIIKCGLIRRHKL